MDEHKGLHSTLKSAIVLVRGSYTKWVKPTFLIDWGYWRLKGGQGRMKTDFILAITQLAAERNLPKDVVFSAVEAALVSAFKKDDLGAQHNISVKINPASGDVKVYTLKTVVEKPTDVYREISLAEAQKIKKDVKL